MDCPLCCRYMSAFIGMNQLICYDCHLIYNDIKKIWLKYIDYFNNNQISYTDHFNNNQISYTDEQFQRMIKMKAFM